jgi:hypothetical protein
VHRPSVRAGNFNSVLRPFGRRRECLLRFGDNFDGVEGMSRVARDSRSANQIAAGAGQLAAKSFHRPDRAVLRRVLQNESESTILEAARSIRLAQRRLNRVGYRDCFDPLTVCVDSIEQHHGDRPQVSASSGDACFDDGPKERLRVQACLRVDQRWIDGRARGCVRF